MRIAMSVLVSTVAFALACGGEDPPVDPGPDPQLPNGVFAAIVDQAEYEPAVAGVLVTATHISITTAGGGLAFSFTVAGTGPGTYTISPSTPHLAAFTGPGNLSWLAQLSSGSGSITITTLLSNRVTGEFSLVLAPVTSSGATGDKTVASGIFNLTY